MSVTVRWASSLAAVCLGLLAPNGVSVAHASAGDDGCVTRAEKRQARHGMPLARVHRIFGTSGERVYLVVGNEEKRSYRMCSGRSLFVTYINGELAYVRLGD